MSHGVDLGAAAAGGGGGGGGGGPGPPRCSRPSTFCWRASTG